MVKLTMWVGFTLGEVVSIPFLLRLVPRRKIIYPNKIEILEKSLETSLHSRAIQNRALSLHVFVCLCVCVYKTYPSLMQVRLTAPIAVPKANDFRAANSYFKAQALRSIELPWHRETSDPSLRASRPMRCESQKERGEREELEKCSWFSKSLFSSFSAPSLETYMP